MNLISSSLASNRFYEIVLYPQAGILGIGWHQPPSSPEYEKGTAALLEAIQIYKVKKLYSDNSRRGNPMPQDLVWLAHQVVPFLCEETIKQLAVIVPENPLHARNLECCLMTAPACYDLQFFQCPQEALSWLQAPTSALKQ
ncbi:hypothetical protein [Rufibacter soli]